MPRGAVPRAAPFVMPALALLVVMLVAAGCRQAGGPNTTPTGSPPSDSRPTTEPAGTPGTASPSLVAEPTVTAEPGQTPVPTGEPPATGSPPPGAPAGSLAWSQLAAPFTVIDAVNASAVGTSPGVAGQLFAVGSSDDAGSGAGWRSVDGSAWERLTIPGAAGVELQALTDGPGGLVAVGVSYAGDVPAPAGWHSTDGRSWQRIGGDLGRGEMRAVAGGPAGYACLGADADDGNRVLAWTSSDGMSWTTSTPAQGIDADATINGIVALGDGFLAFGAAAGERAALWLSADGVAWQSITLPGAGSSAVNEVAVGSGRVVAVGAGYQDEFADVMAWTSPDGRADWQLAVDGSMEGAMFGVAAVGDRFVAVGAIELARFRFDAAVWISDDGLAWQRDADHPTFRQARLYEVLSLDGAVLAVGERSDEAAEEVQPAAWLGRTD